MDMSSLVHSNANSPKPHVCALQTAAKPSSACEHLVAEPDCTQIATRVTASQELQAWYAGLNSKAKGKEQEHGLRAAVHQRHESDHILDPRSHADDVDSAVGDLVQYIQAKNTSRKRSLRELLTGTQEELQSRASALRQKQAQEVAQVQAEWQVFTESFGKRASRQMTALKNLAQAIQKWQRPSFQPSMDNPMPPAESVLGQKHAQIIKKIHDEIESVSTAVDVAKDRLPVTTRRASQLLRNLEQELTAEEF